MTGNVRDNCYPHICLLPTHPHLAFADFVRLLFVATSADPHIHLLHSLSCSRSEHNLFVLGTIACLLFKVNISLLFLTDCLPTHNLTVPLTLPLISNLP